MTELRKRKSQKGTENIKEVIDQILEIQIIVDASMNQLTKEMNYLINQQGRENK